MLGIDSRAARAAWTVFLVALTVAAAYAIRKTLVVFMISLLFAYLLMPLVELVARFIPTKVSQRFALAIVYLAFIGMVVTLAITIGSRIAVEANSLATRLPELLKNRQWIDTLPLPPQLELLRAKLSEMWQAELDNGGKDVLPYLKSMGGQILSGAKYLVYLVLIPILAFFFLKDGHDMRKGIVASITGGKGQLVTDEILNDINRLLGQYIRALVLLSLSSFLANSLFLEITGAPYAVLMAGLAGLAEFIPVVGPASVVVITMLVTGLSGYTHLIAYALFWIIYRLFQDYAASPYLMGRGVRMSPVLVLFGVLAGEQIAGVIGMFLSVPVIAMLRVVYFRLQARTLKTES